MINQEARLDAILDYLCSEYAEPIAVPTGFAEKRALMRALVNVRPPQSSSPEFLHIQDDFLRHEARERGIVRLADIPPYASDARLSVWQGDITRLEVDAIVNAANAALLGCFHPSHGCIDNAIHTHAGVQLRQACYELMREQGHDELTGQAKITPGFNLSCGYVLHTVGPIIHVTPTQSDCEALADCYRACLSLAAEQGLRSIAFCCISTGVYRFPRHQAAEIAVRTVKDFLAHDSVILRIIFNVYLDEDASVYQELVT